MEYSNDKMGFRGSVRGNIVGVNARIMSSTVVVKVVVCLLVPVRGDRFTGLEKVFTIHNLLHLLSTPSNLSLTIRFSA